MTFAFHMLTKDKTTSFGTGTFYFLVGPMVHAAPTTLLKIVFLTIVVNQKRDKCSLTAYNYPCPCVTFAGHT
jgi:hypothetical protein